MIITGGLGLGLNLIKTTKIFCLQMESKLKVILKVLKFLVFLDKNINNNKNNVTFYVNDSLNMR